MNDRSRAEFERLFEKERGSLRRFLRNLHPDDYEDLLSEASIKAFQSFAELPRGATDFRKCLKTIARRTFIDHVRRTRRRCHDQSLDELTANHQEPASPDRSPAEILESQFAAKCLYDALLLLLSKPEQEVFMLMVDGLSTKEMALILDIKPSYIDVLRNRVRSRILTAIKKPESLKWKGKEALLEFTARLSEHDRQALSISSADEKRQRTLLRDFLEFLQTLFLMSLSNFLLLALLITIACEVLF